jgi:hypothetical protein
MLKTSLVRLAVLSLMAGWLAGCATPPEPPVTASAPAVGVADPIDRLAAKLSADPGWQGGTFPILGLPQTASPEQVVLRIYSMGLLQPANYNILKMRQVHIPKIEIGPDLMTAALVQTDSGEKIALFQYDGPAVGWWSRTYDATTLDETAP